MTTPGGKRRGTVRSFVFGSVVGGVIGVAASRVRRAGRGGEPGSPGRVAGLEAFEGAPCWDYDRRDGAAPAERTK